MLLMSMLALAVVQDADRVEATLANYRQLTRATVRCHEPKGDDEIVVCSRRKADNYRVPLVLSANPQNSVPTQTATLLDEHRPPCGEGAFLVKCGSVGVSVWSTPTASITSSARRRLEVESPTSQAPPLQACRVGHAPGMA
ncbi:MAG: hypothetical protein V4574_12565 [Pseudomonadota bacterium]